MNISLLDPYVVKVLKDSGWFEGRKVNITPIIEALENEGYICFEYAREVLESLNGISIDTKGFGEYWGAQFDIDALDAGSGEYGSLEHFELIANEKLFPIGSNPIEFIYVGESKKVYGGCWNEFRLIGQNIEEYLNRNFIKGYPFYVLWDKGC